MSFFLRRLVQRANNHKLFSIYYSPIDGDFFLKTEVYADSSYAAARWFDQNPEFFGCRRRGITG